jgi:hypothetical protein
MELATRRLIRAPLFTLATVGALALGLGAFAVVYTAVQKILVEPMPYAHSDDLYFVWREDGLSQKTTGRHLRGRRQLAGTSPP